MYPAARQLWLSPWPTDDLLSRRAGSDLRVSYLGRELCAIGHSSREELISEMEVVFQFELKKLSTKVRYLAGLDCMLMPDQNSAFLASFLPEGEEVEAFV